MASPLQHRSQGPPHHQSCSTPSGPVCPAAETCTAPPPCWRNVHGCQSDRQQREFSESSHLVLQLVLPVHLMLSHVKVVGGVIVHGLCEAERSQGGTVRGEVTRASLTRGGSHSHLIEEVRLQEGRQWRGGGRVGRGRSPTRMLVALAQS